MARTRVDGEDRRWSLVGFSVLGLGSRLGRCP